MNAIKLASMVSFLTSVSEHRFSEYEVEQIHEHIKDMQEPSAPVPQPVDVVRMLEAMLTDRKIEAIKLHRTLTGWGLKESKDAIERVMGRFMPQPPPIPQSEDTLGSILQKAIDRTS